MRRTLLSASGARNRIWSMTSEMGPRPWKKGWIFPCENRTKRGQTHRSSQTMPSSWTFRIVSSGMRSTASALGPQGKLPKAACTALPRSALSLAGEAPMGPSASPPLPFHSEPCCLPFPSQPSADQPLPFQEDHSHQALSFQLCSFHSQPSLCCSLALSFLPLPFCARAPTGPSLLRFLPFPLPLAPAASPAAWLVLVPLFTGYPLSALAVAFAFASALLFACGCLAWCCGCTAPAGTMPAGFGVAAAADFGRPATLACCCALAFAAAAAAAIAAMPLPREMPPKAAPVAAAPPPKPP
mmetsp:Transcript_56962/g.144524  ORF Transcript_56962/g.144524 Transcript_56962/m.144524 type:complete len:298 (+) Transcript_56962:927-1820(+)